MTAGVLLVALLLSVLIVWRRRSAESRGAGQDSVLWGGEQSWTAYAVTDIPEDDELPPAGWERTMARQQRAGQRADVVEPVDHLELPEETVAFAHVPAPRSGDADRVERSTPRPSPRPAPAAARPGRGMSVRSVPDPDVHGRGVQAGGVPAGGPHGDLRDRLFAVVLGDYDTVVGVLDELAACQQRLGQLSVATDRERRALSAALSRLAATGLRPDQLPRLSDIPLDEVRGLLGRVGADANS